MQIEQSELANGILKLTLVGDLDIAGAGQAELTFGVIAGSRDKVLVDMSGVGFMASIGVRLIVSTAKPILRRGGKMAIMGANEAAARVLASTGVDTIVPVVDDEAAALAALA